jgi:hypothetical protein
LLLRLARFDQNRTTANQIEDRLLRLEQEEGQELRAERERLERLQELLDQEAVPRRMRQRGNLLIGHETLRVYRREERVNEVLQGLARLQGNMIRLQYDLDIYAQTLDMTLYLVRSAEDDDDGEE